MKKGVKKLSPVDATRAASQLSRDKLVKQACIMQSKSHKEEIIKQILNRSKQTPVTRNGLGTDSYQSLDVAISIPSTTV